MEANYLLLFSYVFLSWAMLNCIFKKSGIKNFNIVFFSVSFLNVLLILKSEQFVVITVLLILTTIYYFMRLFNSNTQICYLGKISFLIYAVGFLLVALNVLTQHVLLFCLSFACFVLAVGLKFFNRTKEDDLTINVLKSIKDGFIQPVKKYESNAAFDDLEQLELTLKTIQNWFESSKCYLDTEYSIDQLEKDIVIEKKVISKALNKLAKMNFYNFLAHYRISYAKEILKDNDRFTLESLSNECGFYSKSSFNKYFKMFVGSTPSRFKLNQ